MRAVVQRVRQASVSGESRLGEVAMKQNIKINKGCYYCALIFVNVQCII